MWYQGYLLAFGDKVCIIQASLPVGDTYRDSTLKMMLQLSLADATEFFEVQIQDQNAIACGPHKMSYE